MTKQKTTLSKVVRPVGVELNNFSSKPMTLSDKSSGGSLNLKSPAHMMAITLDLIEGPNGNLIKDQHVISVNSKAIH